MTDLTEQWKKGELKDGYYYVRDMTSILPAKLGQCDNQFYFSGNEVGYGYEENTELEVLAPVPDYNEYQKLLSDSLAKNEAVEINAELEAKIKDLKEYEDIVKSYYMKPIDYTTACETVNKLLDDKKGLKAQNAKLKEIIEKDKKTFAESRIYPAHLISEDFPVKYDIEKLKKQLTIAIEALKCYEQGNWTYADEYNYFRLDEYTGGWCHAEKALEQIEELEK